MLTNVDLKAAVKTYKKIMGDAIEIVDAIDLPEPIVVSICTNNICRNEINRICKSIKTGKRNEDRGSEFIYVFMIAKDSNTALEKLNSAFSIARENQTVKNLCQLNELNKNTKVLYVGRSYSPRERFKQHIFKSKGTTYAIHLEEWAAELNVHLSVYFYQFKGLGNLPAQVIEDGLWDSLSPLLGKRGAK